MKLRLILDVEYKPRGTSKEELEDYLEGIVITAINRGNITGDTGAIVINYEYDVQTLEK